jgi:hypothetical protein
MSKNINKAKALIAKHYNASRVVTAEDVEDVVRVLRKKNEKGSLDDRDEQLAFELDRYVGGRIFGSDQ